MPPKSQPLPVSTFHVPNYIVDGARHINYSDLPVADLIPLLTIKKPPQVLDVDALIEEENSARAAKMTADAIKAAAKAIRDSVRPADPVRSDLPDQTEISRPKPKRTRTIESTQVVLIDDHDNHDNHDKSEASRSNPLESNRTHTTPESNSKRAYYGDSQPSNATPVQNNDRYKIHSVNILVDEQFCPPIGYLPVKPEVTKNNSSSPAKVVPSDGLLITPDILLYKYANPINNIPGALYEKMCSEGVSKIIARLDREVESKLITDRLNPCHGQYGVFAKIRLSQGYHICDYTGDIIVLKAGEVPDEQTDNRFLATLYTDDEYSVLIDSRYHGTISRYANDYRNHFKNVNSSRVEETPNTEFIHYTDEYTGELRLGWYTIRTIQPGQELLLDYGDAYWENINHSAPNTPNRG